MNLKNTVQEIQKGPVTLKVTGNSMTPKIHNGDTITIYPITFPPSKGDIVLCKVNGNYYIHLVTAVKGQSFQISNNHGHVNGWTHLKNIFGRLIK